MSFLGSMISIQARVVKHHETSVAARGVTSQARGCSFDLWHHAAIGSAWLAPKELPSGPTRGAVDKCRRALWGYRPGKEAFLEPIDRAAALRKVLTRSRDMQQAQRSCGVAVSLRS